MSLNIVQGGVATGLAAALLASTAMAAPLGGVVTRGAATIQNSSSGAVIQQTSQRAVIDWASFNIAAGETVTFAQPNAGAVAFNRVPVGAPINISGALMANGGVWLFSPGGLLIGSKARINVGSFVASTAALDADTAMTANRLSLSPGAASGSGAITVQSGAQIDATNGFVLLQAESLAQGGDVKATGAVSYQAAEGALIDFSTTTTGASLNAAGSAEASSGRGKPSLTHAGSTKAGGHVEIAAPAGGNAPGFAGVINLSGIIEATGVAPGGTRGVVILAGSDTTRLAGGFNGSTMSVNASNATITAQAGDIYVAGDSLAMGALSSGRDISLLGYGDVSMGGRVGAAAGLLGQSRAGAITASADIGVGASLLLRSRTLTLRNGATLRGATTANDGVILLSATSAIDLSGGKVFGGAADGLSADVLISAGKTIQGLAQGRGGDLIAGDISGRTVVLKASNLEALGGAVEIRGALRASQELEVDATGRLTIGAAASLRSAKSGTNTAWPIWSYDEASIVLSGADLVLGGTVSTPGDIQINATPSNGQVRVGGLGSSNQAGFELTNAEFQSLSGRNIVIQGGLADVGTTLRVGDLSLSSDRLSTLWIGTGGTGEILASGRVLPTAGAVNVNLGFIQTPTSDVAPGFAPERIILTGAMGAASARLAVVRMMAHGDILLGDDAFVAAARSNSAFDAASAAGSADAGRLLIAAANWQFAAGGRVLQQNTAGAGVFAGVDIGEPSAETPLVVRPPALVAVRTGGVRGWRLYDLSPTHIDLSGVVRSADGVAWIGSGASYAAASGIQATLSETYRMNGCVLGCRDGAPPVIVTSTVTSSPAGEESTDDSGSSAASPREAADGGQDKPKTIFPVSPQGADRTTRSGPDEVTGGGNRDLWIGRQAEARR